MKQPQDNSQELTRAELEVMKILWALPEGAFVAEIIDRLPDPRPAVTTISTIVRILERKGIVGHTAFGRSHRYHPLVDKPTYTRTMMRGVMNHFFDNSPGQMLSFFVEHENLSPEQLEDLQKIIDQNAAIDSAPRKSGRSWAVRIKPAK